MVIREGKLFIVNLNAKHEESGPVYYESVQRPYPHILNVCKDNQNYHEK